MPAGSSPRTKAARGVTPGGPLLLPRISRYSLLEAFPSSFQPLAPGLTGAAPETTAPCSPQQVLSQCVGVASRVPPSTPRATEEAISAGVAPSAGVGARLALRLLFLQRLQRSNRRGPRRRELSPKLTGGRRARLRSLCRTSSAFPRSPTRIIRETAPANRGRGDAEKCSSRARSRCISFSLAPPNSSPVTCPTLITMAGTSAELPIVIRVRHPI